MEGIRNMASGAAGRLDPGAVEGAARLARAEAGPPPAQEGRAQPPKLDIYDHSVPPESTGRYYLTHDEEGAPKVAVDDPEQSAPEESPPEQEWCTGSTDRVEAEIRQLERKAAELEQQLAQSEEDPEQQRALQAQLAQVNGELRMKSTDAYKRQHTDFRSTEGPVG